MNRHEHKGFEIVFYEKQDEDGMWTDNFEVNFGTGALGHGLHSWYARPREVEKFKEKDDALKSASSKAHACIDETLRLDSRP